MENNKAQDASGKVAWVVGGATGIGFATAQAIGKSGVRVAVSGRRSNELARAVEVLKEQGVDAYAYPCDAAVVEQVEQTMEQIQASMGRLDMLVYAAGINVPNRSWNNLDARSFANVVNVNMTGVANVLATALPLLRKGGGSIAIVSSWAGWRFAPFAGAAYSASKTALASIVETLNAQEAGNRIRATLVCPAEVATPLLATRPVPPSKEDLERMLRPEDVADAIAYALTAPVHVCINELVISPLWNRIYLEPERLKS